LVSPDPLQPIPLDLRKFVFVHCTLADGNKSTRVINLSLPTNCNQSQPVSGNTEGVTDPGRFYL
jgi:hypothetical protein